jgi:folate-binding protein YgfZ
MNELTCLVESPETVVVDGADRVRFLNAYCTADVRKPAPNQRLEGFFSSREGRVLTPAGITPIEETLRIDVPCGQGQPLVDHLRRFVIADRVRIELSEEPTSRLVGSADALEALAADHATSGRGKWLGFDSLVIWGPAPAAPACDSRAIELQRIEAATPRFGTDFGANGYFPQELGAWGEQLVDYQKGCYLGQEVIARIHWRGKVQRRPRVLELSGESAPGVAIRYQDRDAGMLTSVVGALGLAILHDRVPEGAVVELASGPSARAR